MQLTDALIGWLISAVITCLVVGFMLIWLGGFGAGRYVNWREAKPRAGPSDQSGDAGGHPVRSEPFWRER
jgi:hypothetical protein